jgi:hypothetical protein
VTFHIEVYLYPFDPDPHFFAEYIKTNSSQYFPMVATGCRWSPTIANGGNGNGRKWFPIVPMLANVCKLLHVLLIIANVRKGLLTEAYFANGCQYLPLVSNGCRWLPFRSAWFKIEPDSELSSTRLV